MTNGLTACPRPRAAPMPGVMLGILLRKSFVARYGQGRGDEPVLGYWALQKLDLPPLVRRAAAAVHCCPCSACGLGEP